MLYCLYLVTYCLNKVFLDNTSNHTAFWGKVFKIYIFSIVSLVHGQCDFSMFWGQHDPWSSYSLKMANRTIYCLLIYKKWTFTVFHWLTFIIHLKRHQLYLQLLFCPTHAIILAFSVKAQLICIQDGSWSAWCYKMESRFFILVLVPLGQHKAPLKLVYWSPFPDWILNSQMLMALLWTLCLFKCQTQLSLALSWWVRPKE